MRRMSVLWALSLSVGCYASHGVDDPSCTANSCPIGTVEVERCVGNTPCFEEARCGPGVFCADDVCVPGLPCVASESEVPFCDESAASCRALLNCGLAVYCQSDLCDALPACNAGERAVESCEGDGAACRSVSVCGNTIYCEGPIDRCLAEPSCESYEEEVPLDYECGALEFCRFVEECSVTIQCVSEAVIAG